MPLWQAAASNDERERDEALAEFDFLMAPDSSNKSSPSHQTNNSNSGMCQRLCTSVVMFTNNLP